MASGPASDLLRTVHVGSAAQPWSTAQHLAGTVLKDSGGSQLLCSPHLMQATWLAVLREPPTPLSLCVGCGLVSEALESIWASPSAQPVAGL